MDTEGSFVCQCHAGYSLAMDERTCVDVDECIGRQHGCEQICTNEQGDWINIQKMFYTILSSVISMNTKLYLYFKRR